MTALIRVEIDADGRGVLIAHGDRWSFDLDLSQGTALLTADGGEAIRVRALRWREKLALARFGGLGEAFVARAIATTCVSARPMSGPDDAALATLAAWLETPGGVGGEAGRALDPEELTSMTVELCRLTGLRPADLDELPAGEVTQLWAAARTDVESFGEAAAWRDEVDDGWARGANRIVVIDDGSSTPSDVASATGGGVPAADRAPAPSGGPDRNDAPGETVAGTRAPGRSATGPGPELRRSPRVAGLERRSADRAPTAAVGRVTSDPPTLVRTLAGVSPEAVKPATGTPRGGAPAQAGAPSRAAAAEAVGSLAAAAAPTGAESPAPMGSGEQPPSERRGRSDQLVVPEAVLDGGDAGAAVQWPTVAAAPHRAQDRSPALATLLPGRLRSSRRRLLRPAAPTVPFAPAADAGHDLGRSPSRRRPVPVTHASRVGVGSFATAPPGRIDSWAETVLDTDPQGDPRPAPLDRFQRDALFQALADELEQATAELGIGSEA